MNDVTVQIGNSDDRLTQAEWSEFCGKLVALCQRNGRVHYSGGSAADAPWQNYCVCVDAEDANVLREDVTALRQQFRQESVAWLQGSVEFI